MGRIRGRPRGSTEFSGEEEIVKIRAAVLQQFGTPLTIEELELTSPGPGEVLVRIGAAGLCHSDLSFIDGTQTHIPLPAVLGHEAAGEVVELGPGVKDLQVGDHVVTIFWPNCGQCTPCRIGRPSLCEAGTQTLLAGLLSTGAHRLVWKDHPIHHYLGCSVFADYAVIGRASLVRIDPSVRLEHAALFGCAVLTGVGAVVNAGKVQPGETVAIVGAGGVGLCAILGAQAAGAGRIVAVDTNPQKLASARLLGATDVFNAAEPGCVEAIRALTGMGVDVAFEFAGSAKAMETAFQLTKPGGTTICAGLPSAAHSFALPQTTVVCEERTVKGCFFGSCVPVRDLPRFIHLFQSGRLPVDKIISGTLPLEQIGEGFHRLKEGRALRQIVIPSQEGAAAGGM
jgi:alcohol dehydrogenase